MRGHISAGTTRTQVKKTNEEVLERAHSAKQTSVFEAKQNLLKHQAPWTARTQFQSLVGFFVLLNAISLGVEADYGDTYPELFYVSEHFFTSAFTLELLLRAKFEGAMIYVKDATNALDFFLVFLAVLDAWILTPLGAQNDLRVSSVLRLLRLMRLARLLRLFRVFKELTIIVRGAMGSMRTLFWAAFFLGVVVYAFSVFAAAFFRDKVCESAESEASHSRMLKGGKPSQGAVEIETCNEEGECCRPFYSFPVSVGDQDLLFGSIDRTMLTLYVCLTEGCGMEIIKPMTLQTPWVAGYWLIFLLITSFGILNIIIGLICDSVLTASQESERLLMRSHEEARMEKIEHLKTLFHQMDVDNSNTIDRDEFLHAITTNSEVMACMENLGLQEEVDLFDTLDVDQSGTLAFSEFFEGMYMLLRASEPALVKDIVPTYLVCQRLHANLLPDDIPSHSTMPFAVGQTTSSATNHGQVVENLDDSTRILFNLDDSKRTLASQDSSNGSRHQGSQCKQVRRGSRHQGTDGISESLSEMLDKRFEAMESRIENVGHTLASLEANMNQFNAVQVQQTQLLERLCANVTSPSRSLAL